MQLLLARLQPLRPRPQQLRATLAAPAAAAAAGPAPAAAAAMASRRLEVLEQAVVLQAHAGRRLDSVLPELFRERFAASGASATAVKRAVRRKEVQVNGAEARTDLLLTEGDTVTIVTKVGAASVWTEAAGKPGLQVVFEDDHMACIVKPQGLQTQGKGESSVQGRIKYCLRPTPLPGALFRPHHAHRLDAGTGGLVLVAKTRSALTTLANDLAAHNMQKRYLALVIGRLEGNGIVDFSLQGKPATTLFRVIKHCPSESFGTLSWVQLWPKTGRTHQLRKHMAYIGHPILGDLQYKHHRNAGCRLQTVPDIQAHLPQLQPGQPAPPQRPQQPAVRQQQQQQGQGQQQGKQQQQGQQQQKQQQQQPPTEPDGGAASKKQRLVAAAGTSEPAAAAAELEAAAAGVDGDDGDGSDADDVGELDAAAAGDGSSGGCQRRQQLLRDGSPVSMCLWAVQLQLLHPHTRELLQLEIDTPTAEYERVASVETPPHTHLGLA